MSIEIPAAHFHDTISAGDVLKVARSDFIEAFNAVDSAVRARLIALEEKPHPMLGQNVDALRKVQPAPQYAKAEKARVDALLTRFAPLQSLRCDVVHGSMEFAAIGQVEYGLFANVQSQPAIGRKVLMVTVEELRERTCELSALSRDFAQRGSTG